MSVLIASSYARRVDGVHDLGGMEGFGPVLVEADEPPFHELWEGRVHGMMMALAVRGRIRNFRYAIERMDPVHYLASPYYEHWLEALERILVEGGDVTQAELASAARAPVTRSDPALAASVRSILAPFGSRTEPAEPSAAFAVGDAVSVRRTLSARHTRCPRYVRGQRGRVVRVHAPSPLHDALVDGEVRPEPYYSIAFDGSELWGEDAGRFEVVVDLWESYLEPKQSKEMV